MSGKTPRRPVFTNLSYPGASIKMAQTLQRCRGNQVVCRSGEGRLGRCNQRERKAVSVKWSALEERNVPLAKGAPEGDPRTQS